MSSATVTKSRLTKNKRKSGLKPGPTGLVNDSSKISNKDNIQAHVTPTPMGAPMIIPQDMKEESAPTSSPSYYRNYDMYTSSPFHIPNSQAPIPGKEVYWDYDTPQSRKCREAFRREFEESDSPVTKKVVTPKLRMVPKPRIESFDDLEEVRKGEQAMQELLDLCEEAEKIRETDLRTEDESKSKEKTGNVESKFDNLSMESKSNQSAISKMEIKEEAGNFADDDMFADEFDIGGTSDIAQETGELKLGCKGLKEASGFTTKNDDMFNEPFDTAIVDDDIDFGDDDDSFLVTATQVENDYVAKKVVENTTKLGMNPPDGRQSSEKTQAATQSLKQGSFIVHPNIDRVKEEFNGFGSEDDSFDMMMSQMEVPAAEDTPSSPVLRKKRKCLDLAAPSQPLPPPLLSTYLPVRSGATRSVVDTGASRKGPVTHQIQVGTAQISLNSKPIMSRQEPSSDAKSRVSGGSLRKFSSFDNHDPKKTFSRVKSEPNIVAGGGSTLPKHQSVLQPVTNRPATRSVCTKEDIERKKREALARRQNSQLSQARK